jgi:DNA-directed RNA polymerase specialized sigma24 family protein
MLGSFEEAEDLVQETLLRAWRGRAGLERDDWFRAWLYKLATNKCLDAIKRDGRRVSSLGSFRDVPWLQPYPDRLLAEAEVAPPGEEPQRRGDRSRDDRARVPRRRSSCCRRASARC